MRNQSFQTHNEASLPGAPSLYIAYQQPKENEIDTAFSNAVTEAVPYDQWIKDYFDNDYSIAVSILEIFMEEMIPEINELSTLLSEKGVDELRKKVHKISPSFKMIGQIMLAAALKDLESDCLLGVNTENLHSKIQLIQAQTEKAKPSILKQYNIISKLTQ